MKGLILPAILVLFASRNNPWARYELLGAIFIIPTLIGALIKQRIYNYRFGDDELVVRDGILTKKERHIPYERIHNIAVVRNPIHRMLGVASARVETASGGAPEAVMRVLPLDAVDELRRRTLGAPAPLATTALAPAAEASAGEADDKDAGEASAADDIVLELPPIELVKLGLISRRSFIVFAAAAGLLAQTGWWDFDWEDLARDLWVELPGWLVWLLESASFTTRALLGAGLVLVLLGLLRGVSVAWHLVKYHGFTLRRERGDLRTDFGLLTRVSSLIPVRRIQLVSAHASLLHRWFDRTSIDLETAGSSESGSDLDNQLVQSGVRARRQYLAPILESGRTPGLLRQILPETDLDGVDWQPLPARARRRIMKGPIIVTALLTLIALTLLNAKAGPVAALYALWLPATVLPLAFIRATGWLRYSAWGLTDRAVFFRSGWLDRSVSVVPLDKVQTVTLSASPFDRRRDMASVAVDTAGAGTFGHRIDIPYLDRDVADTVFERLYSAASSTEFDW
ncbi:MAG: PH domain-containing protein [Acidobacteria bacterium]|nr:PH domain-containing protein [Acidobacteriota bacterium]